jgi:GNAT superfamily N-acetyltransferase
MQRVREAGPADLIAAAEHYLAMRHELDWTDEELSPQWRETFVRRHADGARAGELRYFIAECDGAIAGSAVALVRRTLSDEFVRRAHGGYLANVFVEPRWRRRGIARELTLAAIDWLKAAGCVSVRLQASKFGRPLYESLGFVPGGEMVLRLRGDAAEFD